MDSGAWGHRFKSHSRRLAISPEVHPCSPISIEASSVWVMGAWMKTGASSFILLRWPAIHPRRVRLSQLCWLSWLLNFCLKIARFRSPAKGANRRCREILFTRHPLLVFLSHMQISVRKWQQWCKQNWRKCVSAALVHELTFLAQRRGLWLIIVRLTMLYMHVMAASDSVQRWHPSWWVHLFIWFYIRTM